MAVVGRDLRYVLANPAYQAIADAPVVGRTIAEVFPPAVAEIVQPLVQQVLDSGQAMEFPEYEAPVRGRTWWNVSEIPLRDAAGNTEAVLILTQEVTEQKLAERALRNSERLGAAVLNRINTIIHAGLDPDRIMEGLVREGARTLECDSAAISLRHADQWVVCHVHGLPEVLVGA